MIRFRNVVPMVCALVVSIAMAASAQQGDRAVVLQDTPIYPVVGAVKPLRVAAAGSVLVFVRQQGNWAEIRFQDPVGGLTPGFVSLSSVRIESSQLQPLDLSVPAARSPDQPAPIGQTKSIPTAVGDGREPPGRVFISADAIWVKPLQDDQVFAFSRVLFGEIATGAAAYPALEPVWGPQLGATFNIGAPHVGGTVGVGLRWLWTEYTALAGLAANIPHPTIRNRFASDTGLSGILTREDNIFDFHATYDYNAPRWRIVLLGGPTYFRLKQDMVSVVRYTQSATVLGANSIFINGATTEEVKESTWGFNVGGDASWYFARHFGVGGGLVFDYGTLTIDEPLTGSEADLRVGATTVNVGARFRF